MQYLKKIIALVLAFCLCLSLAVIPSAAAGDTQMYLYNGVELPALPEWDEQVYPYAYLSHMQRLNGTKYIMLRVISKPFVVSTNSSGTILWTVADANWVSFSFDFGSTAWSAGSLSSGSVSGNENNSPVFWCVEDMEYSDGSVYLAASEVVKPNAPVGSPVMDVLSTTADSFSIHTNFNVSGISSDSLYTITASCFSGEQVAGSSAVGPYSGPEFQATVSVGGLSPSTEYTVEYQLSKDGKYTGVSQTVTVTTSAASGSGSGDGTGDDTGDSGSCACPSILNSVLSAVTTQTNFLSTWQQTWTTRMDSLESTLLKLIPVPDPTETALKESVKDTTKEVTDSLFAEDAPTKVTASDVKDVAQIGAAASSMFDSGVSIGSFFDTLNDLRFIAFFSQATYDDLNTVPSVSTYSRGEQNGYVDYYSDNLNKIQKFAGGG